MTDIEKKESLVDKTKSILLYWFPCSEDRTDLLDNDKQDQFDIIISFNEKFTQIDFAYGHQKGENRPPVPGRLIEDRVVGLDEIEELIDYLKTDHTAMVFDKHDKTKKKAKFKFYINWDEKESIKGISCSTIGLVLAFRGNPSIEKKYLYFINKKYFNSSDLACERDYTDEVIRNYIDSLDKDGLLYLVNRMREEDIKKLFIANIKEIAEYVKEESKVKSYLIEK